MKYLIYELRPKQWIKNFFIFLPLMFGGMLFDLPLLANTGAAFLLFSLAAGVVYIVNDIIDMKKDRLHPTKKLRPIASGKLDVKTARRAALLLTAVVMALSFILKTEFGWIVTAYIVFNLIYSRFLKEVVIIDVFCLGAFFLLRVIAGSVITGIRLSHWIVFMTVLLALFLGFIKRRQELRMLKKKAKAHRGALSKYDPYFIDQMVGVLTSSIVVVYMLYTVGFTARLEAKLFPLTFSIPFVYYGIFRYLYLIHKLGKEGDPTRILLSDRMMQVDVVLWVAVCILAIY